MEKPFFFYLDSENKQQGPTAISELKKLVSAGQVHGDSFVWREGMKDWKRVKEVKELLDDKKSTQDTALQENRGKQEQRTVQRSEADRDATIEQKEGSQSQPNKKSKKRKRKSKPRRKLWIYVSGLPKDATIEEVHNFFSKVGLIQEDPLDGTPLITIYNDEKSGQPKGDCSIGYVQEASVQLALKILDGAPFRDKDLQATVKVEEAKFARKQQPKEKADEKPPKKSKGELWEKGVEVRKLKQKQLLSWNEEGLGDDLGPKIVVIKHLFEPEALKDTAFCEDLRREVGRECNKFGKMKELIFFERNPEGVAMVKYESSRPAEECIRVMNGRFFDQKQLEASFWDGITDYTMRISEEEEARRIESFGEFLEGANEEPSGSEQE